MDQSAGSRKPKHLKKFSLEFHFPELPGWATYQDIVVEATEPVTAFRQGFREIKRRKGVSARRIHVVKLIMTEILEPKTKKASRE